MSVWFAIPSKRPIAECEPVLALWRQQGYRIALWRDVEAEHPPCDLLLIGTYTGYSMSVNELVRAVLARDPEASWIVTGGDDTQPDLSHTAEEIATQCTDHFGGTFGVMQPTGDRWANGSIDRIAGSPWMGRDFCERANQGQGPMWPEYFHMFNDEELQLVALRLGVFWQRPDLIHLHEHWMRKGQGNAAMPEFLTRANSPANWQAMSQIFAYRKANGFPGHEPLEKGKA